MSIDETALAVSKRVCKARTEMKSVVKDLKRRDKHYKYASGNAIYEAAGPVLARK